MEKLPWKKRRKKEGRDRKKLQRGRKKDERANLKYLKNDRHE